MVRRDGAGVLGFPDERVRVRQAEVIDVLPELPVERSLLAQAEQVGLVESDEAAHAGALAHGRAEVHVAGALFLHVENDIEVTLLVGALRVRRSNGRFEEAQVADTLVAANQCVAPEDVARHHEDLIPDARFVRDVVAQDVHAIHDGGRAFVHFPPQVHRGHRIRSYPAPIDDGSHAGVDVALVRIGLTHPPRGVVPPGLIEIAGRVAAATHAQHALHGTRDGLGLHAEGIEALQVLVGKPPTARDLEGADAVPRTLLHHEIHERLAPRAVYRDRILEHLRVEISLGRIERWNALAHVPRELVCIELALLEPQEALGLGLHRPHHILPRHTHIAGHIHAGHGEAPPLIHSKEELHFTIHQRGFRLHFGHKVAFCLVERVDALHRACNLRGIERLAHQQVHPVAHVVARYTVGSCDVHAAEQRPLAQVEDEARTLLVGGEIATGDHVVELARGVERLDGTVERTVVDGAGHEPGIRAHLDVRDANRASENDGIGSRASPACHGWVLRTRRRPHEQQGDGGRKQTSHLVIYTGKGRQGPRDWTLPACLRLPHRQTMPSSRSTAP